MKKRTDSDIALSALAVEAERRRKAKGLLRYSYGDLVAEITPEERQRIIEDYKAGRYDPGRRSTRYIVANDEEDIRAIREKLENLEEPEEGRCPEPRRPGE